MGQKWRAGGGGRRGRWEEEGNGHGWGSYGVASCKLLLRADDCAAALGGVEGALASNNCFSSGAAAAGLAADLGDGIPVFGHGDEQVTMNMDGSKSDDVSFVAWL